MTAVTGQWSEARPWSSQARSIQASRTPCSSSAVTAVQLSSCDLPLPGQHVVDLARHPGEGDPVRLVPVHHPESVGQLDRTLPQLSLEVEDGFAVLRGGL